MHRSNDHDPTAPNQLLDRYQGNWHQRLVVGLSIGESFDEIHAALVLCKGYGKWLHHQWSEHRKIRIPETLAADCRRLTTSESVNVAEFVQAQSDLGEILAVAANNAISLSGKAADLLLTVSVVDPGLWVCDFDGKSFYQSFCDANRLADKTGLTVIDAFPARDIANGGNGKPIDLLPLWMLFADRNARVATRAAVVVRMADQCDVTFLPPSDGLDEEFPEIKHSQTFDPKKFLKLVQSLDLRTGFERVLSAKPDSDLITLLSGEKDPIIISEAIFEAPWSNESRLRTLIELIISKINRYLVAENNKPAASVVHLQSESRQLKNPNNSSNQVHLFASPECHQSLRILFQEIVKEKFGESKMEFTSMEQDAFELNATIAGILGFMNLDQMAASIPWVSGCNSPRTLGRLTPGSPTNWRQVIVNMADFHPPAMKLRDAV